jgi:hypothetical protein
MRVRLLVLGLTAVLAITAVTYATKTSAARSDVLTTPPLPALGTQFNECYIVNASRGTKHVVLELMASGGTSVSGPQSKDDLGPGQGWGISYPEGYYCRFTVDKREDFRASIAVLDGAALISALPAS